MYKATSICRRSFDVILKFENLQLETQQFLKYMKWDGIIPPTVNMIEITIIASILLILALLNLAMEQTFTYQWRKYATFI